MTKNLLKLMLLLAIVFTSCSKKSGGGPSPSTPPSPTSSTGHGNPGNQNQPGVITAGEWNDLDNWAFWETMARREDFKSKPAWWGFYNTNRISVTVTGTDASPVVDALVVLKRDGNTLFTGRTDNSGKTELWADLFQSNGNIDLSKMTIVVNNGAYTLSNVKLYKDGINNITIPPVPTDNKIEIAFVVDATGSMGDELEYLKTELLDVITRVKTNNPNAAVATGSVFYRDNGDSYITRISGFTNDANTTLNFIKGQSAGGGGDFPEAVHTALEKSVNELQWSTSARTRLLFLVLDAPPHHDNSIIADIQRLTSKAAEKGIKIIPVTASGIGKETESLMRYISMSTNGTYVFITDDSGVGNDHLEATVGNYKVELLNELMVRLINKYAK